MLEDHLKEGLLDALEHLVGVVEQAAEVLRTLDVQAANLDRIVGRDAIGRKADRIARRAVAACGAQHVVGTLDEVAVGDREELEVRLRLWLWLSDLDGGDWRCLIESHVLLRGRLRWLEWIDDARHHLTRQSAHRGRELLQLQRLLPLRELLELLEDLLRLHAHLLRLLLLNDLVGE